MRGLDNKKIALFMLPLLTQGGGAEKYFIELARSLRERGIEADIVTMDELFFRKFAKLLYLWAYRKWFLQVNIAGREAEESVLKRLGKARWIKAEFKNLSLILKQYDIIYSKNELVDLALIKWIGYGKLPPVVVGVHTPIYFPQAVSFITKLHNFLYLGFVYRFLLRGAKCIHLSNKSTQELAAKNFKIENKLIYYPFSVDAMKEAVEKYQSRIKFAPDKIKIIYIGRLSEQKGIDRLMIIIDKITEQKGVAEKIEINIFGSSDREHENILKKMEREFSFVRYHGHAENRFIPHILSQHDFFISTSRWETLPFNILEAQAMGLPAIAFDIPGPADIIEDGNTGFLVKTSEEFVEKMVNLIRKNTFIINDNCVKNIRNKFDSDKIYLELINMLEEHLSNE